MLDWMHVFILSVVQGITEFLPVSSSAHLILLPKLFGWEDQGLAFDVAVHLGTLLAIFAYFRKDLVKMISDFLNSFRGKPLSPDAKLLWAIGFGTIPVGLAGLIFKDSVETTLRSPFVIAFTTIGFGILLLFADKLGRRLRNEEQMNWKDVFFIGCGQALALIPGTSRSGITLTAGLARGLTRESAARFSFLLSIPVIFLAGIFEILSVVKQNVIIPWPILIFGVGVSAITGFFCIDMFIKLLNKMGVMPFVIYRVLLGLFLLWVFV